MSNVTCPVPFLNLADYGTSGYIEGRFCAPNPLSEGTFCCVPCPIQDLVFSDNFEPGYTAAYWISVPSLILMVFLLLTFILFPGKEGHGHYLNWGMLISVCILELCFLIPLAAKPTQCYDAITPHDMYTSAACATSGAFLLFGAMATVSWVLVRSVYTHLRVVWNIDLPRWFPVIAHSIGWGLPIIFLAVAMPITGVNYQVSTLCLPKPHLTQQTWFGWYLAFSALAVTLQFATTGYCIAIFVRSFSVHEDETSYTSSTASVLQQKSGMFYKHNGWKRVKKVLLVQWRSIAMCGLIAFMAIYFCVIYLIISNKVQQGKLSGSQALVNWAVCLIVNNGNKVPCLDFADILGVKEASVIAAFVLVALIGIISFLLMVRRSMLESWYHAIRDPRQFLQRGKSIDEAFIFVTPKQDVESPIEMNEHDLEEPLSPSHSKRHEQIVD